jgi:uncharacterized protein (UPF0335 family)
MFTKERVNEILAVCEKSPLGPWKYEREEQSANAFGLNLVFETVVDANGVKILRSNDKWLAQFIALARTALPEFVQRIIELEEENAKLQAVAEIAHNACEELEGHGLYCITELKQALTDAGYGG